MAALPHIFAALLRTGDYQAPDGDFRGFAGRGTVHQSERVFGASSEKTSEKAVLLGSELTGSHEAESPITTKRLIKGYAKAKAVGKTTGATVGRLQRARLSRVAS
jgi:hypothetical protein